MPLLEIFSQIFIWVSIVTLLASIVVKRWRDSATVVLVAALSFMLYLITKALALNKSPDIVNVFIGLVLLATVSIMIWRNKNKPVKPIDPKSAFDEGH